MINDIPTPFSNDFGALGALAKLLATEDVTVIHENTPTASFDTEARVLSLPMWKVSARETYHMLIEHEVGHALWTEQNAWIGAIKAEPHLKGYFNIVEDARIERMFKVRFPGSRRDFRIGYGELWSSDLLGIRAQIEAHLPRLSIGDRLNMFFKFGDHLTVPFYNDRERDFISKIEKVVTFDDVIRVARELYEYSQEQTTTSDHDFDEDGDQEGPGEKGQPQKGQKGQGQPQDGEGDADADGEYEGFGDEGNDDGTIGNVDPDDSGDDADDGEADGDDEGEGEGKASKESSEKSKSEIRPGKRPAGSTGGRGAGGLPKPTEIRKDLMTQDLIDATLRKITTGRAGPKVLSINEKFNPNPFIISYEDVLKNFRSMNVKKGTDLYEEISGKNRAAVNFLVQQFEMKKAAKSYAKTREDKTGIINPNRLHAYKISDDLFRRAEIKPEFKNHGMVMIVDFSGSMSEIIHETMVQTMALVEFCRKQKIPHRVFAFSDNTRMGAVSRAQDPINQITKYSGRVVPGTIVATPSTNMRLVELFNNNMTRQDFALMAALIFSAFPNKPIESGDLNHWDNPASKELTKFFGLGGTPLNCAMLLALPILKEFKAATKTDHVSLMVMTDGDSGSTSGATMASAHNFRRLFVNGNRVPVPAGEIYHSQNLLYVSNMQVISPTLRRTKTVTDTIQLTSILSENISAHGFPTIMYRIGTKSEISAMVRSNFYKRDLTTAEKMRTEYTTNGSCTAVNTFGFDRLYMIGVEPVNRNYFAAQRKPPKTHVPDDKLTPTQLRNRMIAEGKAAMNTRRIMTNFIDLIAKEYDNVKDKK